MAGIEGLESNIVAERIAAMNGQENVQPPEPSASSNTGGDSIKPPPLSPRSSVQPRQTPPPPPPRPPLMLSEVQTPQLFTKTRREYFDQNTAKRPYLTFRLGPGELQRLVVKIWSNDQGWCDDNLKTDDPFGNSHTWFSLGLIENSTFIHEDESELHEFQRNVRASSSVRCYTNQWNLGIPAEEDKYDKVHAWMKSLADAEGSVIGVFPLARYLGWVNSVLKMEVLVYSKANDERPPSGPQAGHGNAIDIDVAAARSNAVRIVSMDEIKRITMVLESEYHSDWAADFDNRSKWRYDLYKSTDDLEDLDKAIHFAEHAVETTTEEQQPLRAGRLSNLSVCLSARYARTGVTEDIEEAIRIVQRAIKITPVYSTNWALLSTNLGDYFGKKYSRTSALVDLDEAIYVAIQIVEATPEGDPNRCIWLNNLVGYLDKKYSHTSEIQDLDEIIRIAREVIKATPGDHPNRLIWLRHLGDRLGIRYERNGVMADLEESVRVTQQAIEAAPKDHPDRAGWLINLGIGLGDMYSRTEAVSHLEDAIHSIKQAIDSSTEDHPERATMWNNLGHRLSDRYSRTGDMMDLEEAISVIRRAIKATKKDHPSRTKMLSNLGLTLGDRYSRIGALADLEEAISLTKQAIKDMPKNEADQAISLTNLGMTLKNRYSRFGAMADLEEAICVTREAVQAIPADRNHWYLAENNLGVYLIDRFRRTSAMADLEESIHITKKVVDTTPESCITRAGKLKNLSVNLSLKYSRTGAIESLEEAICIAKQTVENTPEDHPNRADWIINYGLCLLEGFRFNCTGTPQGVKEILGFFTAALDSERAVLRTRIFAGRLLLATRIILHGDIEAYRIAQTVIGLVPLSAPFSLQSADKQHLLSQAVGLASDAAAVALHVGKGPLPAIELLETGRGVIASSLQDIRTDVSLLQETHPELAQAFTRLRNLLDMPTSSDTGISDPISPAGFQSTTVDQRHKANSQMTALLSNIRRQADFETFLMAANEAQMREAAAQGPIVFINVSHHRCDALIVEKAGVRALQLQQLSREEIVSRAGRSGSLETLSWLWTVVAKPVLDTLGFTQAPADGDSWPHMWWIPTGPLISFPLHAAGHHLQCNGETVLDRVVSSYASSVKSIINTRQQSQMPRRNRDLQAVLVAMQETPAQSVLHHAINEVDAVRDIFDSIGVPFRQSKPYQEDVLNDLSTCRIFHFAGHGRTDSTDPLHSCLLLRDWQSNPLSVGSLLDKINLRSTSPFLAYLSACGTGQILDDKSVDESVHLTSAFQLAGFRHVIGTLWEVDDELCVDMARLTYKVMSEKGFTDESVSFGLHYAMRTLRSRWIESRSGTEANRGAVLIANTAQDTPIWVPYVHYGV